MEYSLSQLGIALPGQNLTGDALRSAAQRRLGELARAGYTADWFAKTPLTTFNAQAVAAYRDTYALAYGGQAAHSSGSGLAQIIEREVALGANPEARQDFLMGEGAQFAGSPLGLEPKTMLALAAVAVAAILILR